MGAIDTKETKNSQKKGGNQDELDQRSRFQWAQDGSPICMECKIADHIRRDYPKIAQLRQARWRQDGNIVCFGCVKNGSHTTELPKESTERTDTVPQGNAGQKSGQLIGQGEQQQRSSGM